MDNDQPDGATVLHSNPATQAGFTIIPNVILTARRLTPGSRLLYGLLKMYAWQAGNAYPGQQRLADEMGVSTRQIRNYQSELEAAGLIRVEQRGLRQTNRYWIEEIPGDFLSDRKDISGPDRNVVSALDRKQASDKEDTAEKDSVRRESDPPAPLPDLDDVSPHLTNGHSPNSNGGYVPSGRLTNARPVAADEPPPVVVRVPPGTPVNRRPDAPPVRAVPKPDKPAASLAQWKPDEALHIWWAEQCMDAGIAVSAIDVRLETKKWREAESSQGLKPGQYARYWRMWMLRAIERHGQQQAASGKAPPRRRSVNDVEGL